MEAFLQPLQGLAEFEEIKKRCGANRGKVARATIW